MRVKALWYGGSSYSAPDPARDLETFNSLRDARAAFESRADHDPYRPCVDESTELHVYIGEYSENGPDRIFRLGTRGGTIMERV